MFPRVFQNSTYANAHQLAKTLVHNRITRSRRRELSSFGKGSNNPAPTMLPRHKHDKKTTRRFNNKSVQCRSKPKKSKGHKLSRTLNKISQSIAAG